MTVTTIEIYSKFLCPYCSKAKRTLDKLGLSYQSIEITFNPHRRAEMIQRSGRTTVPQIFVGDVHIGGSDDLEAARESGLLNKVVTGK